MSPFRATRIAERKTTVLVHVPYLTLNLCHVQLQRLGRHYGSKQQSRTWRHHTHTSVAVFVCSRNVCASGVGPCPNKKLGVLSSHPVYYNDVFRGTLPPLTCYHCSHTTLYCQLMHLCTEIPRTNEARSYEVES